MKLQTKGGGGVENPEHFADVLYVWSQSMSNMRIQFQIGSAAIKENRFASYVLYLAPVTFNLHQGPFTNDVSNEGEGGGG